MMALVRRTMRIMSNNELYITLRQEGSASLTEKKSEFIGYAAHVESEREALDFIARIKHKHSEARHNVYAYVLKNNNIMRYSDDGEPQGTAGMPVLDVIRKSGFTDAVIVVTRYFGGILLGTGGLVRAYSAAAKLAVQEAQIVEYELFDVVSFVCDYQLYPKIQNELGKIPAKVESTDFAENITVRLSLPKEFTAGLGERLSEMSSGRIGLTKCGVCYGIR